MLVTNKDIENDIGLNLMVRQDVIKADVVRDMMFYMREQYERELATKEKHIQILDSALKAINTMEDEPGEFFAKEEPKILKVNNIIEEPTEEEVSDTQIEDLLQGIMKAFYVAESELRDRK